MMNNSTDDDDSCYDGDTANVFKAFAILNMSMGLTVCVMAVCLLRLLHKLKKHLFYYQRLVMYLNVAVIFNGVVSMLSFDPLLHHDKIPDNSIYCTVVGFLYNWSTYAEYITIWWISFALFSDLSLRGVPPSINNAATASWKEKVMLAVTFILPPLLLWVIALPGIDAYGPHGPLCDIRLFNYTSCDSLVVGHVIFGVFRVCPLGISFLIMSVLLIISVFRIMQHRRECKSDQVEELIKIKHKIIQLQVYPLLFVAVSILPAIYFTLDTNINDRREVSFVVFFLDVMITSFRSITVSTVFAFDQDTRKRLKTTNIFFLETKLGRSTTEVSDSGKAVAYSYNESDLYTSYGDSLDAKEVKARQQNHINAIQ